MKTIQTALIHMVDAIEDTPGFPFGEDLRAASDLVDRLPLASPAEVAKRLQSLIDGARSMTAFPFGADIEEAEACLADWRATQ